MTPTRHSICTTRSALFAIALLTAAHGCKKEDKDPDEAAAAQPLDAASSRAQPAYDASAAIALAVDASAPSAPPEKKSANVDRKSDKDVEKPRNETTPRKETARDAPGPTAKPALPSHGKKCASGGKCAAGLECVTYYGIAGANGPKFTSCERRCGKGHKPCPGSMRCAVIADGPGQVCR